MASILFGKAARDLLTDYPAIPFGSHSICPPCWLCSRYGPSKLDVAPSSALFLTTTMLKGSHATEVTLPANSRVIVPFINPTSICYLICQQM